MLRPVLIFQSAILNLQLLLPALAFSQGVSPAEAFPFRQPPVDYFGDDLDDPVASFARGLRKVIPDSNSRQAPAI